MGLMDMFSKITVCPECRQRGAKQILGMIKCPNSQCKKYDSQLIVSPGVLSFGSTSRKTFSGNFNPGSNAITIKYKNYLGEDRMYEGDRTTLREKGEHISLCIVPTGKRVSFKKQFIKNMWEIEKFINKKF